MTNKSQPEIMPPASGKLVHHQPSYIVTPMEMIAKALQKQVDPQVLAQLTTLQERWQANAARQAFDLAMARAQADIKPVAKNRRVHFKSNKPGASDTDYMHEDFAAVSAAVHDAFRPHGLSFRFNTQQPAPGQLTVTCIISHEDGHREENTLSCAVDTSGNKNHLQAIGSAQTYLQRYTLKAAVGMAASNDDDGRGGKDEDDVDTIAVTAEQAEELRALLRRKGRTEAAFMTWATPAGAGLTEVSQLPAEHFEFCKSTLTKLPDIETRR